MAEHDNQTTGQAGAGSSSAGTQNTESMIPKSRFDEVNERMRRAEEALAKFRQDTEAAEAERLKKQGEWQQIAENERKAAEALKPYRDRAEALEAMLKETNAKRIERVPEAMRSLIPVDYPPERLSAWLESNWERLIGKPAPDIDAGAGAATGSGAAAAKLTAEELELARLAGMTPEQYAESKQIGQTRRGIQTPK